MLTRVEIEKAKKEYDKSRIDYSVAVDNLKRIQLELKDKFGVDDVKEIKNKIMELTKDKKEKEEMLEAMAGDIRTKLGNF